MNKVILSIIGLFLQTGLLYAQSTDDERFANWTEEQYQHYEDSVRTVLYPPVFACKADDSAVKISQKKTTPKISTYSSSNSYVPTYRYISTSKEAGQIEIKSGTTPTGGKTYEVPLKIGPGMNGHQPNLALAYNSQQGNSVLGMGWAVSGLSQISRCGNNLYYDNKTKGITMDNGDGFVLDDVRLIKTGTYSTYMLFESEQGNIKVKGYYTSNLLKYFDVFYPDGSKARYGFATNTQNKLSYPLTSLADMDGNTINYSYTFINEHYNIDRISFNGSSVEFKYASGRNDPLTSYSGGVRVYEGSLINEIVSKLGSSVLATYSLTYTTQNSVSLLTQIDYTSLGKSFNPLVFYYGEGQKYPTFSNDSTQLYEWYVAEKPSMIKVVKGKFDYFSGMDGLIALPNLNPYWKHYRHSTAFRRSQNNFKNLYGESEKIFLYAGLDDGWSYPMPNLLTGKGFIDILCADLEGKQQEDVVKINNVEENGNDKLTFTVYRSNLYSGMAKQYARTYNFSTIYNDNDGHKSIQPKFYYTGDFNGDGKQEVLAVSVHQPFGDTTKPSKCYVFDLVNNKILYQSAVLPYNIEFVGTQQGDAQAAANNSDKLFVFDYDGDGKSDICHISSSGASIYTFDVNGTSMSARKVATYSGLTVSSLANRQLYLGDFNGDGLMDFLQSPSSVVKDDASWTVFYSKGDGSFVTSVVKGVTVNEKDGEGIIIQDVNSDGKSDIVKYMVYGFYAYLTSDKVFGGENPYISFPKWYSAIVPTNLNSNNVFTQIVSLKDGKAVKYHLSRNDSKSLLMTGMANSLGVIEKNEYHSLTDGAMGENTGMNVYTKGSGASFPYVNIQEPLVVLSASETYHKDKLIDNKSYSYDNAVVHKQGLGFCGFAKVTTVDKKHQTYISEYDPVNHAILTGETTPVATNSYRYAINVKSNKLAKIRLVQKTENDKLSGVVAASAYVYDDYGYPTKETTNYNDGSSVVKETTYNSFTNIDTDYRLGVVQDQQVTTTYKGNTYVERNFVPVWGSNKKPTVTVLSKNGSQAEQTVYYYDSYGKVISSSVTPYQGSIQKTQYTYDSYGRVVQETNPENLVTKYTYDNVGNMIEMTDARGGVTKYEYDDMGREITASYPDNTVKATRYMWNYDNVGVYAIQTSGTKIPTSKTVYDAFGRETRSQVTHFDNTIVSVDKVYDEYGNLEKVSLPFSGSTASLWNTYSYDAYNRLLEYAEASGHFTRYSYSGNTTSVTTDNVTTTKTNNVFGQLVSVTDPAGTIEYNLGADGQPKSVVAPGGVTTSFEYDVYGRRTALVDPSAGRTTYEYDKGGNVAKVTDAKGQVTTKEYDSYNRVVKSISPELTTTYAYNTVNDLVGVSSDNGTSKSITYDGLGRITSWRENVVDGKWLQKDYSYADGTVSSIKYTSQDGVLATEKYKYTNSYLTGVSLDNGKEVYRLRKENVFGQPIEISSGGITRLYAYDSYGYPMSRMATKGSVVVQNFSYKIDPLTGNLVSRKDETRNLSENFSYDNINRLTDYPNGTAEYDDKGNVLSRSDVGSFEYGQSSKPYAMTGVNLSKKVVPSASQDATYTSFNRLSSIEENDMKAQFVYNGDYERVKMEVSRNGSIVSALYYMGDCYELQQTESGSLEKLYLAGDYYDAPMVYVKEGPSWKLCNILRDNLGSITHVTDYDGTLLQELSYDAWGRLRNPETQVVYDCGEEPALYLGRGYTGHEHLIDFGLVNMNARMYDPATSRFLSPDNYVQSATNSQNFNRYSYCMNNPLKYTDQSGEFWNFIIGAAIGGIVNWATHGCKFNAKGLGYFATGAVAGAVGAGVASGMNVAMAGGSFWSGAAGLAHGVASTGFIAGAVTGASSGFAGGFLSGAGNAWVGGRSFGNGLLSGLVIGGTGALGGGVTGGLIDGFSALGKGVNFWTGKAKFDLDGAYSCSSCMSSDLKVGESTITGKYVGKFEGQKVFESKLLGNIDGHYRAFTAPERGIIVAKGVFTSGKKDGVALLQHEFGHILQYRMVGSDAYWNVIAPESFASASLTSYRAHDNFWTETWANFLSNGYFGKSWIGPIGKYPIQNISSFNMCRLRTAQILGLMRMMVK